MTQKQKIFKIALLGYFLVNFFLSQFGIAFAQTAQPYSGVQDSIKQYLCTPPDTGGQTWGGAQNSGGGAVLYNCIKQIYKFAIVVAGIVGTFFIIISGYNYIMAGGNSEKLNDAKARIEAVIASIAVLSIGYLFLKTLNPDIVEYKPIQPLSVTLPPSEQPSLVGAEGSGGGNSSLIGTTGPCAGCVDYTLSSLPKNGTQHPGQNTFLQSGLVSKLTTLKNSNTNWRINEAYPPTVDHSSACHFNGSCADIGMQSASTQALNELCKAAKQAGLSILNEYNPQNYPAASTPDCPAPQQYVTTTGGHLHVQ